MSSTGDGQQASGEGQAASGQASPSGSQATPSASQATPLKIFINYRRDDAAGDARGLYDRLKDRFGAEHVFFDVELEPGMEWLKEIKAHGVRGGAFLALIGSGWATMLKGRRASDLAERATAEDYVRREIEWALRDWPGFVIPVLIGASMPDALKLPRSIRALTRKHAAELRHASFNQDVAHLIERLDRIAQDGADPLDVTIVERRGNGDVTTKPSPQPPLPAGVMTPNEGHYQDVLRYMVEQGAVVPILGSHVCGSLPDARELAEYIADDFHLSQFAKTHDLAGIAQYVAVTIGDTDLYNAIRKALGEREPNAVHRFLAQFPKRLDELGLPPRHQLIITTNYDRALERAFEDENEPFDVAIYLARTGTFVHLPWGEDDAEPIAVRITTPESYPDFPIDDGNELERTVIVKIHGAADGGEGNFDWKNDYVVTEDQYIDYLPTDNVNSLIPFQILAKLRSSHCLFLGYMIRDWNARVFLRRLWQGDPLTQKSWAIEREPDVLEKDGWGLYPRVELLASALTEYVDELDSRLAAQRPTGS